MKKEVQHQGSLDYLATKLRTINTIVISFFLLITLILIIIYMFKVIFDDSYLVGGFEVSPKLTDHGYTSNVISQKLIDQMHLISKNADGFAFPFRFGILENTYKEQIHFSTKFKLIESLPGYLRRITSSSNTSITGELTTDNSNLYITVRLHHEITHKKLKKKSIAISTFSAPLDDLDSALYESAEFILYYLSPITVAIKRFKNNDKEGGYDALEYCVKHCSENYHYNALKWWAGYLLQDFRLGEANEKLHDLIKIRPNDPFSYLARCIILINRDRYNDALNKIEQAADLDPTNPFVYFIWGSIFNYQGMYTEAEEKYRKAISLETEYPFLYMGLGFVLEAKGSNDKALSAYEHALTLDSKYSPAYAAIGNLKYKDGRLYDACDYYRMAIEHSINPADIVNDYGNALFNLGKFYEASTMYNKSISLAPNLSAPYINLAKVELVNNNLDEARAMLEQALNTDVDDTDRAAINASFGAIFLFDGQLEKAKVKFEQAKDINPDYVASYYFYGILLREQDDINGYEKEIQKAISLEPSNPFGYYLLAHAFELQGENEAAKYKYLQVVELHPEGLLAQAAKEAIENLEKRGNRPVKFRISKLSSILFGGGKHNKRKKIFFF